MNILIVDDDAGICSTLSRLLWAQGHSPRSINTPAQLMFFDLDAIDVVLLDFHLDGWDGTEAIGLMKSKGFDGVVIVISGMSENARALLSEHALKAGLNCIGSLSKPLRLQDITPLLVETENWLADENHLLNQKLKLAVANDELGFELQPQYHIPSGKIFGAEILARWTDPDLGRIPPDKFVNRLARLQLEEVFNRNLFQFLADLCLKPELASIQLTINLSLLHISQNSIVLELIDAINKTGRPTSSVTIEITEDILLSELPNCVERLNLLKEEKFKLFMDDFGTGNSTLQQLLDFRFDGIKLDSCFVRSCITDKRSQAIVESTLDLATRLDIDVVVEGIENITQLKYITKCGGKYGQGFHWSPSIPSESFIELLRH